MISDEPISLIRIRPHHIGFFSEYYVNDVFLDRFPEAREYGKKFVAAVRTLFESIVATRDSLGILVVDGERGDSICDLCKIGGCNDRNIADGANFKSRHTSGTILLTTGLTPGTVYTTNEFLERVRKLYPHRTPKHDPPL